MTKSSTKFSADILRLECRAWVPAFVATLVLVIVAVTSPAEWKPGLALLAAGVFPLLVSSSRWPLVVALLAIIPSGILVWSVLTATAWSFGLSKGYAVLPAAFSALATIYLWWRRENSRFSFAPRDTCTVLFAAVLYGLATWVCRASGPVPGGQFQLRPGTDSDTLYLFALVEQAVQTWGIPRLNPFLPGAPNSYAGVLHAGLAGLSRLQSLPAIIGLWNMLPALVASNALLLPALLAKSRRQGGINVIVSLMAVGIFISYRIDLLILPHTQACVFPIFFLLAYMLGSGFGKYMQLGHFLFSGLIVLILPQLHLLTAVCAWVYWACQISDVKKLGDWIRTTRGLVWLTVLIISAVFIYLGSRQPYSAKFSTIRSPEATGYLWQAWNGWIAPLVIGFFAWVLASRRHVGSEITIAVILMIIAAAYALPALWYADSWTATFSIFNSVRFFYVALFALLPAVLRLRLVLAIALLLLLTVRVPHLQDVSAIVLGDAKIIKAPRIKAYDWVRRNLGVDARLVDSFADYALPAFTGRTALVPADKNTYALNMVAPEAWSRVGPDFLALFGEIATREQKAALLKRYGITHVLSQKPPPPNLPGVAVYDDQGIVVLRQ